MATVRARVSVRVRAVGAALLVNDRPRVHKPNLLRHVRALVPGLFGVLRVLACGSHHLSHRRHRIAWRRMVRVRVSTETDRRKITYLPHPAHSHEPVPGTVALIATLLDRCGDWSVRWIATATE